jgi:transcriptional regulator with XRE-family HTH domain
MQTNATKPAIDCPRAHRPLARWFTTCALALCLSQAFVAHASGLSQSQVSRIERGVLATLSIEQLCRIASVIGLDLSVKLYPGGAPLRDQGQTNLIDRFRPHVGPPLGLRAEVPVPIDGDRRAWDLQIVGAPKLIGLEAETRIVDCQALQRRIALKARDSNIERVILLVSDTRANRAAIRAAEASFREMFPVPARDALRALREGRDPGGWAIIML